MARRIRRELVDISVTLEHETDKAWLVNDGTKKVWIPMTAGELVKNGRVYTLTISESLAEEKGLI